VPELRLLLLALEEPAERFAFRLAWSHWRRHHQAVAQQGHRARRARRVLPPCGPAPVASPAAARPVVRPSVELSEAEWQRILPLLPARKPGRGRPAHDHRPLVAAMVWVERTGASWRQVPAHVGPWHRVYNRYRLWRRSGLWARLVAALEPPSTVPARPTTAHAPPALLAAA
jgi:transposase